MEDDIEIRGEYWVIDGELDFADGDVGDRNHEMIAIDHVFSNYSDAVENIADHYGIEHKDFENDGVDVEAISDAISEIEEYLTTGHKEDSEDEQPQIQPISEQEADALLMREIGCNRDAYLILRGGGDGRLYCMVYEGWIAIRGHNVELYGYDNSRRQEIGEAVATIIYEENNLTDDQYDPEQVDLYIYDIKTSRGFNVTLQSLISNEMTVSSVPNQPPKINSTPPSLPDQEENNPNYGDKPPAKTDKWTQSARDKGMGFHPPWKPTSENVASFYEWLIKNKL